MALVSSSVLHSLLQTANKFLQLGFASAFILLLRYYLLQLLWVTKSSSVFSTRCYERQISPLSCAAANTVAKRNVHIFTKCAINVPVLYKPWVCYSLHAVGTPSCDSIKPVILCLVRGFSSNHRDFWDEVKILIPSFLSATKFLTNSNSFLDLLFTAITITITIISLQIYYSLFFLVCFFAVGKWESAHR